MAPTANHPWCVTHQTNHRLGYSCSPISRSSKEVRDIPEPQQNRSSKAHVVHPSPKEAPDWLRDELRKHWIEHNLNLGQYKSELWCVCGAKLISDGHAQDWRSSSTLVFNNHIAEAIAQHIAEQVEAIIGEDEPMEVDQGEPWGKTGAYGTRAGEHIEARNQFRAEIRAKLRREA